MRPAPIAASLAAVVVVGTLIAGCAGPSDAPLTPSADPDLASGLSAGDAGTPAPGANATPSTGGVRFAPTASGHLDGKVIVVDPGHNGTWVTAVNNKRTPVFGTSGARCQAAGATALDKTTEHTLVWEIAQKLVPLLRSEGATVVLTRPDDIGTGPCNNERAEIANRNDAAFLISIHGDGAPRETLRGFSVIYAKHSAGGSALLEASKEAAEHVLAEMAAQSALPPANYVGTPGRPIEQLDLGVLNNVKVCPAVLLETGNLIQADDWATLNSDAGKEGIARALAAAAVDVAG